MRKSTSGTFTYKKIELKCVSSIAESFQTLIPRQKLLQFVPLDFAGNPFEMSKRLRCWIVTREVLNQANKYCGQYIQF
jgi:hypothetical protein